MGQLPARAIFQITGVVAGTLALIWYLLDDPQLSRRAGAAFDAATAAGHKIYLPTICIVEATYLVEKKRIAEEAFSMLEEVFKADLSPFELVSLTPGVAQAVRQIPRDTVPDLPDRVIAPENGVSPITAFGPPSVCPAGHMGNRTPTVSEGMKWKSRNATFILPPRPWY